MPLTDASKRGFCVIVPVRNGGGRWREAAAALRNFVPSPRQVIVIDSGSSDASDAVARSCGFTVETIPASTFNHGRTRQYAVDKYADPDGLVVFLTQDAVLTHAESIPLLLDSFADQSIGCAYGRQLPHADAGIFAAHAVGFNYPRDSARKTWSDRTDLGIKAAFLSNSFAAYRVTDLYASGGFPDKLIAGEDVYVAMNMLRMGRAIQYCAAATVRHSHNNRLLQDTQRYFDFGVMHAQIPQLNADFGESGGEGFRFAWSELCLVARERPSALAVSSVRSLAKFLAYRLGRHYRLLPRSWCRNASMTKGYWDQL